jgi:3-oxoacyl-[acyl-carrier protein] reductase
MAEQKVMLITGTRKGIGQKLAHYYLELGYLVIGCSRGESTIDNKDYQHFQLDVANEKEVLRMFSFIRSTYSRLDILINNAGIASMNHSLLTPVSTASRILETNVIGSFLMMREAAKLMKKNKFGRMINFTTFAVPFKLEGEAIYAASKAAVQTLTEILAREFADLGITVNAVAPPATQTDLVKGVPKNKMDGLIARQAIHRFGNSLEVSNVIDFFIKPESDMVTGQIVFLGGI